MNKEELLQGLHKALKIAEDREELLNQYTVQERKIGYAKKEAETVTWEKRAKAAKVPLIIFLIINFIFPQNMFMLVVELIIGLGALFVAIIKMVQAKKIYFNSKEYADKLVNIEKRENELAETLGASINATVAESLAAFPALPIKYHTCFTLSMLIDYFECGRADTLKEALEAYETDCHRMRMEESQSQMLQEVQELQNRIAIAEQVANAAYYRY